MESALEEIDKIENRPDEDYIRLFNGKTDKLKEKWKINKEDNYFADYRILDLYTEINAGGYEKQICFIKYGFVQRNEDYNEELQKNYVKDLSNNKFAETAKKIYGEMALVQLLKNFNDSLALSQVFRSPVTVDIMHGPLLRVKAEYEIGKEFSILERLSEIVMPDFGTLNLDELLQLRKDKSIRSFRKWIHTMSTKLQSDRTLDMETLFIMELLKEIKEIAPNKKEICIEAALGGLSFIPIPLLGIATSITDFGQELKKYNDFSRSWLSFILRSARSQY